MKRLIEQNLIEWKNAKKRKPLLINGIRQVGKTWSVKKFGENYFDNLIYINFDLEPSLCDIFIKSKDPKKIIFELSIIMDKSIDIENTLIFFDEIQSCNEALNSLKYFEESEDNYYVIGAGSYLGIALAKENLFPVGKVEMLEMKPLTFKEFILAKKQERLIGFIESISSLDKLPDAIFQKITDLFREYYIVGGMPEVVQGWILEENIESIEKLQQNILNAYSNDFSKYPQRQIIPRILRVWNSIIRQLSKENRKFKYSDIDRGARAREYETALDWLIAGNYLSKVEKVDKLNIPLKGYVNDKHFKIYMPDIGLLREKAEYPVSSFSKINDSENIPFKGAISENFVFQELSHLNKTSLFYWSDNTYEIDFIIQKGMNIYPIEVKYGNNIKSKSLTKILKENSSLVGIRYSMMNLSFDGQILNIPLPLISETYKLLELVEKQIRGRG